MSVRSIAVVVAACWGLAGCATDRAALESFTGDGEVDLACNVAFNGSVYDCVVERESPRRLGLGRRALRASTKARLAPLAFGDPMRPGMVRFTVRFRMENGVPVSDEATEPRP